MGKLFYILFLKLYYAGIAIASLFNHKAKLWIKGRKNIFLTIGTRLSNKNANRIWIHCSSLGEFEQARPLIESLRKNYPRHSIVLTFFSPSGYEHEKNYEGADHIFYLPMDSNRNAKKFFDAVQPKLVIFIKYEFWFYYLHEAKKRRTALLLVSATFRKDQPFFHWYGGFHRKMLRCFTHLFVQNDTSLKLQQKINVTNASISGDTRFDRVLEITKNFKPVSGIEDFCEEKIVIVAGSTWLEDDEELDHYANSHPDIRFIIAPHDIGESRLKECERLYHYSIRYSQFIQQGQNVALPTFDIQNRKPNTLIVDNVGMLKYLYSYASICYVGGGFGGDGVHNVLEAAVYSKPVVFGPVYEKYPEAAELIAKGGAFSVIDAIDLEDTFNELLDNSSHYNDAAENARDYVYSKAGATEKIMKYIQEKRLLTN
jgi:3-deoxy-D-manno-octulosonic-acid transferase